MPLFTVELISFEIVDTRSFHEDTDYLSFTLVVQPESGPGSPQTKVKSMGNLNSGIHGVSLLFENVPVLQPTDHLIFNYMIVNSSSDRVSVETALELWGAQLVTTELSSLGWLPLHSDLQGYAPWLYANLHSLIIEPCDGFVAVETEFFYLSDLLGYTANGRFSQSVTHHGTSSPIGCGSNSTYIVNWQITQEGSQTVPDVYGMAETEAAKAVQAAGLVAVFHTAPAKSPGVSTSPWVSSQSPVAGQMVAPGTTVTMVLSSGSQP